MTSVTQPRTRHAPMTLWRLEIIRLVRTHRWMILFGVYAFFGALGPLTARYFNDIMGRFAGEVTIVAPDPRPVDGIIQFVSNASQLGLLAVVVVAAAALSLDAKPELAAFLRTKIARLGWLLLPPYATTVAATWAALVLGTGIAWAMTAALIGPLAAWPILVGTLYGAVYLAFAVAVVAVVAGFTRSQATTVLGGLGALLVLPIVGIIDPVQPWLPSALVGAIAAMLEGAPASEYLRALLVSVAATVGLVALAARRLEHREL